MKNTTISFLIILTLLVPVWSQKKIPKKPNSLIFAVLNNGKTLEPLAKIENGKLVQTVSGGDDAAIIKAFSKTYYKPKSVYNLIFGGNVAGTATVVKNDPGAECSPNLADAVTKSAKAKLKGFVMALATDIKPTKTFGTRRMPTPAERTEIEKLVATEFAEKQVKGKLNYHNLTALDLENDGDIEFVGSFWVANSASERALLFFIADSAKNGVFTLTHQEFKVVKKEEVMSGEMKDVDDGIYHELLLDVLDYNNDGVAEIFTYTQSFEGAGFAAYQRKNNSWEKVVETANYHCGY